MGIREEQKKARRELIMQKGLELFIEKGFTATKIADIATAAEMSTGLMFHYFESKEALCEEIVKLGLSGTKWTMTCDTEDVLAFFEEAAKGIFTAMEEAPMVANIFLFMSRVQKSTEFPAYIRDIAFKVDVTQQCVPLIERGQKEGVIKEGNPLALSLTFWCAIQGIAEQVATHGSYPLPDYRWLVDIIRKH
ncbi:TetR/AcrR family transcriptional regulator [Sporanaerobium hydrogeniformans]|uniref:TetR/AcrR family transcriptional regulator n=1 Tax=Sporanaerobium hydrogeniformans TaxID=3072179 RepID=UPI0015D4B2D7|nr:TetR/AcrR family transcriptional regulator [Sporanaerobium hydrogeniformans]